MNKDKCVTACHECCCDNIDDLETLRGKVTPDTQAVLDRCVKRCRECCTDCQSVVKGLRPTPNS